MPGFPQIGEEEAQNKIKQNKQNKTKHRQWYAGISLTTSSPKKQKTKQNQPNETKNKNTYCSV